MFELHFRFPAHRYHATAWNTHVNEGHLEWPPSPWRIIRSLYSIGHTHLGWNGSVPDAFNEFVEAIAACPPSYRLPRGVVTHSRHYMPQIEGRKQSTSKVFDTSLRLTDSSPLVMRLNWEPTADAKSLFDDLLGNLAYLGRAESWVEAAAINSEPDLQDRVDHLTSWLHPVDRIEPIIDATQTRLLSVVPSLDYDAWRNGSLQKALQTEAVRTGKKLSKKAAEKVAVKYPGSLLECVAMDTTWLQRSGWSQPPGTRWIDYQSQAAAETQLARPRSVQAVGLKTMEYPSYVVMKLTSDSISGKTLPPVSRTIRVAEALHNAIVSHLTKQTDSVPPALSGRYEKEGVQHGHLHFLPIDLDEDGRLDHVLLHCPRGVDDQTLQSIRSVRMIHSQKLPRTYVTMIGYGELDLLSKSFTHRNGRELGILQPSQRFHSVTPFVPSRFLKLRNNRYTLSDNVKDECRFRKLPEPEVQLIRKNGGRFHLSRLKDGKSPPQMEGFFLKLSFSSVVSAIPLTLGYGSHFGLGLFTPDRTEPPVTDRTTPRS